MNNNLDLDSFIGNVTNLISKKMFRTAWTYITSNVDPDDVRIRDTGILIEQLSNEYGDIGELKDDCILRKKLSMQVNMIIKLLK